MVKVTVKRGMRVIEADKETLIIGPKRETVFLSVLKAGGKRTVMNVGPSPFETRKIAYASR